MGQEITLSQFDKADFEQFYQRLKAETILLEKMLQNRQFSQHSPMAGFEIEAWLVDEQMKPAPINSEYLTGFNDPMAFLELAKFNIELNSPALALQNDVFSQLEQHLQSTWHRAYQHARQLNAHLLMIGTLPTLKIEDLTLKNISEMNRYFALNEQILKARGKPIHLEITGCEHLEHFHDDVMLEAATTSFQIHLQLPIDTAHHFYNASIMASAPMVALSANAPYLFGKDLWHETRIPLFEQAIETGGYNGAIHGPLKRVSFGSDYARQSIMECFTENLAHFPVLLPEKFDTEPEQFEHLRLHNGTIWRWNRPLIGFDEDGTPHIRVEQRTPAAGPTVIDTIANAVFFYGLTKSLGDALVNSAITLPFSQAKDNFYQAARFGLDSTIIWTDGHNTRLDKLLLEQLLPRAKAGLESLMIDGNDIEKYLGVIEQRVKTKQNGCQWQRQLMKNQSVDFKTLVEQYLANQQSGHPVSEWSV